MNIAEFNVKYKDKGGFSKLNELRGLMFTYAYIGDHFGVSRERAKQWILEAFGENESPRKGRRERIVESMLDFAKFHSEEEFNEAFCLGNQDWVLQALTEARQRGLYLSPSLKEKHRLDNPHKQNKSLNNEL